MNDSTVQFGLLKFVFGTGAFARNKVLFIHINGEKCSALKRGRFNTKKGLAKDLLGSTAAEVIMSEISECTVDNILEHLSRVIAADKMGDFSIAKMKADYENMVRLALSSPKSPGRRRRTAREMGSIATHTAIEELRKPLGAFNWCLFKGLKGGELDFLNAGSMSLHEMQDWLKPDEVSFGLLRLGFGTGRFRRTKFIFIHWSGERVGAVSRGRANAQKADMARILSPFSVELSPTSPDEITLEVVIDKVRRAAVIDGDEVESKASVFSVESFMAALEEERAHNAAFFGDDDFVETTGELDFAATVRTLHTHHGDLNWGLFEVRE